jgi:hypothetical protein
MPSAYELDDETAGRVRGAIGRDLRPPGVVQRLEKLPPEMLDELDTVYRNCGGIYAFAYLRHLAGDATFSEVKAFVDSKGWHHGAD